jgi:hypothetical protein
MRRRHLPHFFEHGQREGANIPLETDVDGDGKPDTGVYIASRGGALSLVALTGTVIPSIGTVVSVTKATINDRGQVGFAAQLSDGRTVLLLATPK